MIVAIVCQNIIIWHFYVIYNSLIQAFHIEIMKIPQL